MDNSHFVRKEEDESCNDDCNCPTTSHEVGLVMLDREMTSIIVRLNDIIECNKDEDGDLLCEDGSIDLICAELKYFHASLKQLYIAHKNETKKKFTTH